MALLSFFRRRVPAAAASAPVPGDNAAVQQARTRARNRLIGAVVLLAIGVITFPLLFETEPRPIPVDLPIEIPRKEGAPPLVMPPAAPAPRSSGARPAEPPREAVATQAAPGPSGAPAASAPPKPVAAPASATATIKQDDGARAKALLEGAALPASRFVVQVGAFAEDKAVREVRAKVEKLGLQTYTQVVKADAGERTRVRVGPFARREDADAAAAKLKQAGLPAAVLKL